MRRTKTLILSFILVLFAVTAFGCGKQEDADIPEDNQTVVFRYGDNIVTVGEVYIYICTVRDRYEMQYGEDVWQLVLPEGTEEGASMVELTKQEVVEEIVRVKTLIAHAEDYSVVLSEKEQEEIRAEAEEFYAGLTDADKQGMELTEEKVYQVMSENSLAQKVEKAILADEHLEISDEQARMTTFYDMYFECYSIDENGVVTPYSEEERTRQYNNALQACSTLATAELDNNDDGKNIEKLANYYGLEQAKEQTLNPNSILEIYGQSVYELLYSMENGDYSTVIESEYGYHVFQMIALTDQRATAANKEIIQQETVQEVLADRLIEWQREIDEDFSYPESVNMDVYDSISLE